MRVAVLFVPARVPVRVTVVIAETGFVLTVNVAVVAAEGTVTLAGTVALIELDVKVTTTPAAGAAALRVTVPVEFVPPVTDVGDTDSPLNPPGVMVSDAVPLLVPFFAVIVAVAEAVTVLVVTVNVAVVAPVATVTEVGTVALVEFEERVTITPADGAGPVRVTVPVEGEPPITDVGLRASAESEGGFTVRFAVLVMVPSFPVMVAIVAALTALVFTVNVADVEPAGTVTDTGTVAETLDDVRETVTPPVGAAVDNVAVPVEAVPPVTEVGETVIALSGTAVRDRVAVLVVVP